MLLNNILGAVLEQAAVTAHEVNRAYCQSIGDNSQPAWEDAPDWQKDSARAGVLGIAEGNITTPEQAHESWCKQKLDDGWKYGATKDPEKKEHHCLVPYDQLPPEQRTKDALYFAVVTSLVAR